jgi:hypothetical protein
MVVMSINVLSIIGSTYIDDDDDDDDAVLIH